MTVSQLIERLEEYREELGNLEVRLMTQSHYPLEHHLGGLASAVEIAEAADDSEDGESEPDPVLYIVEGQQLGYGNKRAWEVAQ
jgi:hypothetical protein